jgi:putative ABC transport system permease protein
MSFVGICLGVTALVAMDIVTRSVYHSFEDSINQVAGRTALEISAGESGFAEQFLDRVQKAPGIASAAPVIEGQARLSTKSTRTLTILGVDVHQDQQIRNYRLSGQSTDTQNPLMLLSEPNTILITQALAEREGIKKDQNLRLETIYGMKTFKVGGLLNPEGPAKVAGGDMAVMDLHTAQMVFGKEGRVDRIDLTLLPGQTSDAIRNRLRQILPEGYQVEPPASRIRQFVDLLKIFRINYYSMGFFALVVGLYLIFNSAYISVVARRKEIGILRVLGTTRGQIIRLFLSETLILSFLAAILGLILGIVFAKLTLALVQIEDMIGVHFMKTTLDGLLIDRWDMAKDVGIGILSSLLAATVPAVTASRITPVSAIRLLPYSQEGSGLRNKMMLRAIVFFVLSFLTGVLNYVVAFNTFFFLLPVIFFLGGMSLSLPFYLKRFVMIFRRILSGPLGAAGRQAGLNLQRNIFRNAVVVGAIAVSIAIFVFGANIVINLRNSALAYSESYFQADMYVTTGEILAAKITPMPGKMAKEIEQMPGVLSVVPRRNIRLIFQGLNAELASTDITRRLTCMPSTWLTQRQSENLLLLLPDQNNIMINDVLAARYHLQRGDSLTLPTPDGKVRFGIAAVGPLLGRSGGEVIMMDSRTYQRYWQDTQADYFAIILHSKNDFSSARQAIIERFGKERRLFVSSSGDLKEEMKKNLSHGFWVFNAIIIMTLIIACLGLVITLLAAILERKREIGILRAIGMTRRQITGIVIIESTLIGAAGGVLGAVVGLLISWRYWESLVHPLYGGILTYHIQYASLIWALVLSIGLSSLAAFYPARQAAKTNIVEALTYE